MMQMLVAGGMPALTDNVRAHDDSNPRGYFEFEPVMRLRTEKSWLGQAQGRAVKIIHLLLRELPTDDRFQYRVLFMKRPIQEVVASQRMMLEQHGKKSADETALTKVYEDQVRQVEDWLRTQPSFHFVLVEYHRILKEPVAVAKEINLFLGADLDTAEMARVVDPALCHQNNAK
jgi:hypothetical protein